MNTSTIQQRAIGTPFEIIYQPKAKPRAAPTRKKSATLTKAQQTAIALETPKERKERQTAEILRKNSYSDIARSTDADKTGRIVGRRNEARSQ